MMTILACLQKAVCVIPWKNCKGTTHRPCGCHGIGSGACWAVVSVGGEGDWTNYAGGENWLPVGLMDGFACFVLSVYVCV